MTTDGTLRGGGRLACLTRREGEVLALVAEGLTSAEVADRLVLSERTVHAHLRAVFTKLGVRSRTAATRLWCDQVDAPPVRLPLG